MTAIPFLTWVMLIAGVLLNAIAQLLIKAGTNAMGAPIGELVSEVGVGGVLVKVITNWWILGGLACYVVSVGLWIIVLSQVPVSMAYPMLSIGYIFNALAAFVLFRELLSVSQWIGIGVIVAGVVLVANPKLFGAG